VFPENADLSDITMAELASFCIRKMASLEARFVILCHRAQAAGIDTADLCGKLPSAEPDTRPMFTAN
jgi:hypothetical protein